MDRPGRSRASRAGELLPLAASVLLTAGSVWMAASERGDRRFPIGALAFFGTCTALLAWLPIARSVALRNAGARSVEIAGSVPFRIRRGRGVALLVAVTAVMSIVAWGSAVDVPVLSAVTAATAALCGVLVPIFLYGPPARRAIVFEPDGLRLAEPSWEVCVPWDEIAEARLVDVHDTLLVAVRLRDPAKLTPVPRPPRRESSFARRRFARAVALNRLLYGCDVSIGPVVYGLDAVLFHRAVETYVSSPDARRRLAPRAALAPPFEGQP